jgi:hypothetical protein
VDKTPAPLNGRIIGFALSIVAMAVALRVAWSVIQPLLPGLLYVAAAVVIYRIMFRGRKH